MIKVYGYLGSSLLFTYYPYFLGYQLEMKMFPSLAADYVHIELDRIPNGPISIIVYNEAGLPVLFKKNENITQSLNFEIDIKALPKGIYFIKLLTSDKFEKTQKIIKL